MVGPGFGSRSLLCIISDVELRDCLRQTVAGLRPAVFAVSAAAARSAADNGAFDAYVIEHRLPDGCGVELCRHLRRNDPNVPVVLVREMHHEPKRWDALEAGVTAWIEKSIDAATLRSTLVSLLASCDRQSLLARAQAARAVGAEQERESAAAIERRERTRELSPATRERIVRTRAYQAFIEAGGARSQFDRWWSETDVGLDRGWLAPAGRDDRRSA